MQFTYVDMVCKVAQKKYDENVLVEDVVIEPVRNIETEALYQCYLAAFRTGDAKFFTLQDEAEQRRYFDEDLGFPDVLENPASFAYVVKDKLIGFALVLQFEEKSYHISCMCILPEHQGRSLARTMLNRIKNIALENGCTSLTLGTEPEMKAYHLYKNNGFVVTEEHTVTA